MLLIIKGTKEQAAAALSARDIPAVFVAPRLNIMGDAQGNDFPMSTFRTDEAHGDKVSAWFVSDGAPPYPPGSLLHYQYGENGGR